MLLSQHADEVIGLQLHVRDGWFTDWAEDRRIYYGNPATPTLVVDGLAQMTGVLSGATATYNWYAGEVTSRAAIPTNITITGGGAPITARTYRCTFQFCMEPTGSTRTTTLNMVEVLDYWPHTCEAPVRNGLRQAAKSAVVTLKPDECITFTEDFTFDDTSWDNQQDIKIVAWAQETAASGPAEVYQAAQITWPFPSDCNSNGVPDDIDLAQGTSLDDNGNGVPDECERIPAGIDLWTSFPGGLTALDLTTTPIPADFFDPGSDPFTGALELRGEPLDTLPSGALGLADTVVERLDDVFLPGSPSDDTTAIRIAGLRLVGTTPAIIGYAGGATEEWDVEIVLSDIAQPHGTMTIYRDCFSGGTYEATLPVSPRLLFTRRSDQAERAYDFGVEGVAPWTLAPSAGRWVFQADPGYLAASTDPGVTLDNNLDGVWETTLPGSSNFVPGIWMLPCDPNQTAGPSEQRMRVMHYAGAAASLGLATAQLGWADYDVDGIVDDADNCWLDPNPLQEDGDADSVGDACDFCVQVYNPFQEDTDFDSVGDICDNCVYVWNTNQVDTDQDGVGDVCDVCGSTPPGGAVGPVGCSIGDMNCNGTVGFDDINPFVEALIDPLQYEFEFPDCDILTADCDGDGQVGFSDINPFVDLLLAG